MAKKKEKQVFREVNIVLGALRSFENTLLVKGRDFNSKKIQPLIDALSKEVSKQGFDLIADSKIPEKPRTDKTILEQLAQTERLTPEILEEIKRKFEK